MSRQYNPVAIGLRHSDTAKPLTMSPPERTPEYTTTDALLHDAYFGSTPTSYSTGTNDFNIYDPTFDDSFSFHMSTSNTGLNTTSPARFDDTLSYFDAPDVLGQTGFHTPFEEQFSFQPIAASMPAIHDVTTSLNITKNNLLQFGPTSYKSSLLDTNGHNVYPSISAELQGNFFLAESETEPGPGLTCYRRNIFRVMGSVTFPRNVRTSFDDKGANGQVTRQEVCISATESIEGKSVEILHVPLRTARSANPEDSTSSGPPSIPVELSADQSPEADHATVPIAWKRLQFKSSTANNGRRNGVQQQYRIKLKLIVTLLSGEKLSIAEVESDPLIVQGRSVRNFAKAEDRLAASNNAPSRNIPMVSPEGAQPRLRTATTDIDTMDHQFKTDAPTMPMMSYPSRPLHQVQPTPFPDWTNSPQAQLQPNLTYQSSNFFPVSIPTRSSKSTPPSIASATNTFAHVALQSSSSGDDLFGMNPSPVDSANEMSSARKMPRTSGQNTPSLTPTRDSGSQLGLNPDSLYEYFPLGIDGWMPPVDAVYRPHVAHNTVLAPELKALFAKRGLT